ncbi:MAG: type III pantothenate kinase [Limnobacter sp.]|nr:type III pantothenate kinase [Limnobacter sp.]
MGTLQMSSHGVNNSYEACIFLDAGNTRIKWVVTDGAGHQFLDASRQTFPTQDLNHQMGFTQLAQQLAQTAKHYNCQSLWVCHVLGTSFFAQLDAALQLEKAGLTLRAPVVGQHAMLNTNYSDPTKLGQDRWVACLAVLGLTEHSLESAVNCVVSFGTATTVDALVRTGSAGDASVHLGGVIFPGLDLMLDGLHRNTAQLPKAHMQFEKWPTSTESAIASGVIRAQWSAVEGFVRDLEAQSNQTCRLWVHGGHAETLLAFLPDALSPKLVRLQDAVFHGLRYSMRGAGA